MRIGAWALTAILFCGAVCAQDLTITSKITSAGGPPQTATSYVSSDRLRLSQPDGNEAVFDLKSGDMTMIDSRKKTYFVITQKDIDDMVARVQEQMNSPQMKRAMEQMKSLPPEQRKKMEQMMGGMFAMRVEKSGTSRTIAGDRCEEWTITIGKISKSEQCVSTEVKLPLQAWQRYRKLSDTMRAMMSAMGPMASSFDSMRQEMEKIQGFPLASSSRTTVMGREMVTTSEVVSIERGPIPPTAWEIPAGYTKTENPMRQAMKGQPR